MNIAITNYCNLHCPYCFANEMITTTQTKNMSIDQLNKILSWANKDSSNKVNRIGIIGGEPTLHPEFLKIVDIINKYCTENNAQSILFTNGVYLQQYLEDIPNTMSILINVNTPTAMAADQWEKLNKTLDRIRQLGWFNIHERGQKATLGCNLCPEIDDYSFFWNIASKYVPNFVRVSVTSPSDEKYLNDKDLYFKTMKPKFIEFINTAFKYDINVTFDCSQIPSCYFTKEEMTLINTLLEPKKKYNKLCNPVVDITSEFKASSCFGCYEEVDCGQFKNFDELYNYMLYTKVVPKTIHNNTGICATCKQHELIQCQGGCLAFSK